MVGVVERVTAAGESDFRVVRGVPMGVGVGKGGGSDTVEGGTMLAADRMAEVLEMLSAALGITPWIGVVG